MRKMKKIVMLNTSNHFTKREIYNRYNQIYSYKVVSPGFWGFGEIGRAACRERVC